MNSHLKPISEIMTRNVCQVGSEQTVLDALARMRSKLVSSVLVVDGDELCGIITERDFVRAVHTSVDFRTMKCSGLMQSPVVAMLPEASCLDVYHQMAGRRIRHIAIIDSAGKIVGLANEGDLMRDFGLEYYMNFKNVGGIMTTEMGLLKSTDLVVDAVELMYERSLSCIMVVDDGRRPIGMLTERDVVGLCGDHPQFERMALGEVMHSPVKTVTANDLLHDAVKAMAAARIRRLAVVNDVGAVIGLLTHHEIVRQMDTDYAAHIRAVTDLLSQGQIQFKPLIDEKLVLATLLSLAPETALLAADLNYHIGYMTPGAPDLLGLDADKCEGVDVRDVLEAAGWGERAHDDIREAALADGQQAFEAILNNSVFVMRVFLMRDDQDRPCGFLVRVQRKTSRRNSTRNGQAES